MLHACDAVVKHTCVRRDIGKSRRCSVGSRSTPGTWGSRPPSPPGASAGDNKSSSAIASGPCSTLSWSTRPGLRASAPRRGRGPHGDGVDATAEVPQRLPLKEHAACSPRPSRTAARRRPGDVAQRAGAHPGLYGLGFDDPALWRQFVGGGPDAGHAPAEGPRQPSPQRRPSPRRRRARRPETHAATEATQLAVVTPRAPPPPTAAPAARPHEQQGRRRAPKHERRDDRRDLARNGAHIPAGHQAPPNMAAVACADLTELNARELATADSAPMPAAPGAAYWVGLYADCLATSSRRGSLKIRAGG